jgi:hypothetical protein
MEVPKPPSENGRHPQIFQLVEPWSWVKTRINLLFSKGLVDAFRVKYPDIDRYAF